MFNSCTEHEFSYENVGENHFVGCKNCDYNEVEEHSFVDGTCICGAQNTVLNESLSLTPAISVGAEMQVVYSVRNAQVKDFERFYIEVVKEVADGESVKTVFNSEDMEAKFAPNGTLAGYSATYTGIFAMEMGDDFTATLYAVDSAGKLHYGPSATTSIKSYLMAKLEDERAILELKALAVDMLNYGASAQVNFHYNVNNLVNADLTDTQKAFGTQQSPSANDHIVQSGEGSTINASVSLQSKVLLYISCSYTSNESSKLEFVVRNALTGKELERFTPNLVTKNICQGIYGNVAAQQMRELITVELYDNGRLVSRTLTWSVESYVAQIRNDSSSPETLIEAVNAMLAYGDSAARYFDASGQ